MYVQQKFDLMQSACSLEVEESLFDSPQGYSTIHSILAQGVSFQIHHTRTNQRQACLIIGGGESLA